jgi:N utilization substance protein A
VRVPEDQLSLAIGKQGQNVRLAAKLTGWNIDIISADESRVEAAAAAAEPEAEGDEPRPKAKAEKVDLESSLIDAVNAGSTGQADVLSGQEPTE